MISWPIRTDGHKTLPFLVSLVLTLVIWLVGSTRFPSPLMAFTQYNLQRYRLWRTNLVQTFLPMNIC